MEAGKIQIRQFDRLTAEPGLEHAVFTRQGGNSTGPFDSLNVGMNSGDRAKIIASNRKLIIRQMGMKPHLFLNQVHGKEIQILKKEDNDPAETVEPGGEIYTADGIITDMEDLVLVIQVADCQAVMFYDPEKRVIANVHSGWRGSVGNIAGACVDKMRTVFGCRPERILAGIGPSLGPCCAEFIHYRTEIPKHLWPYKAADRDYFDFWQMTADQLKDKGIKAGNIENMKTCTKCNTRLFYSYREEKTTGRFACVIAMV